VTNQRCLLAAVRPARPTLAALIVGPGPDPCIACCVDVQDAIRKARVSIAHTKLDLEDRLNKRRQQKKRREEIAEAVLRKVCAALQLASYTAARSATSPDRQPDDRAKKDSDEQAAGEGELSASCRTDKFGAQVRRRHAARPAVVYSDAEIKSLLKSLD